MAITSFTIAGSEVDPMLESFDVRETVGGVSTLSCDVISVGSPVERFSVFDEVVIQEDGVTIFSGLITQVRERGFGGEPNLYSGTAPEIVTTITAEDQNRLAERITVTEEVAEGTTLEAFLTVLVDDYLDTFGVTLDGSQATGPGLPAVSFDLSRASEVLQSLADATGYLWRIDYDKKLRMWLPGDLTAPFDIDEFDTPAKWYDDVEVETILGDNYANRVKIITEPKEEEQHIETFTGDGATSTYALNWTLIQSYGIIHLYELDGITPAGGETFGIPPDAPLQWAYDGTTNTITRLSGPTDPTKIYSLRFHGTFQAEAEAEDAGEIAAHGLYEHVERRSDIATQQAAQDFADALLAQLLQSGEQIVSYSTRRTAPTLRAGQSQEIVATARDVAGDYIIRDMRIRAEVPANADGWLTRSVTAKQTQPLVGKWQHTYRDWLKVGKGSATSPGAGGALSSGPAPPVTSVQFNRAGAFGGDADFTYDETTATVMIGPDHTPGGDVNLLVGSDHTVN